MLAYVFSLISNPEKHSASSCSSFYQVLYIFANFTPSSYFDRLFVDSFEDVMNHVPHLYLDLCRITSQNSFFLKRLKHCVEHAVTITRYFDCSYPNTLKLHIFQNYHFSTNCKVPLNFTSYFTFCKTVLLADDCKIIDLLKAVEISLKPSESPETPWNSPETPLKHSEISPETHFLEVTLQPLFLSSTYVTEES